MRYFVTKFKPMPVKRTKRFMSYRSNLFYKLCYGGIPRVFFDTLSKVGIKILLYYRIVERLDRDREVHVNNNLNDYEFGFLIESDMQELAAIPIRNSYESESELRQRLDIGMKCFGAKHKDRIVSYSWYRFDSGELLNDFYPLKQDEAYMFDVNTIINYRGKGLAPYINQQMCKLLCADGITKLFSFTNIFNNSYIQCKMKLDAQIIEKGLLLILFKKYRYHKVFYRQSTHTLN